MPATGSSPLPPRTRLDALTSLRFFAAAMIVIYHFKLNFPALGWLLAGVPLDQGVSFFFILSGFILAHVYGDLQGDRAILRFLQARLARIWPAHAVITLLFAPLTALGIGLAALALVLPLNLLLVHAWLPLPAIYFSMNMPSWSISTELVFYLAFPLLIRHIERTWGWKLALTFLMVVVNVSVSNLLTGHNPGVDHRALIYIHPSTRLFEFMLGICTCVLWKRHVAPKRGGAGLWTALEVAALLAVVAALCSRDLWYGAALAHPLIGPAGTLWLIKGGASCGAVALLILAMATGRGWLSRLLSHPALVYLGEISFAVYLFHGLLLIAFRDPRVGLSQLPMPLLFSAFWLVLLAGSALMFRYVETPSRALITQASWPKRASERASVHTRVTRP